MGQLGWYCSGIVWDTEREKDKGKIKRKELNMDNLET